LALAPVVAFVRSVDRLDRRVERFFVEGPLAARSASRESACGKVNSPGSDPRGSEALVWPSVT
jgi:hypothetical protein